jgi:hypothetical protein
MFNRNVVSAMVGGMALGAGVAVTVMANAQYNGTGQPPGGPPPGAPLSVPLTPPPPGGGSSNGCGLQLTALAADTFVTVKDSGDSQTVSVFKVDPNGTNRLSHKAKFFY